MGRPALYLSTQRLTVGQEHWNRAATSAFLDHQAGDPQTSTRGQGRVSVGHQESTFRVWLTGAATPPLNQPKALSSPQRLRSHPLNQPSRPVHLSTIHRPHGARAPLSQRHTISDQPAQMPLPIDFADPLRALPERDGA